ncbi:hypothetical protein [Allopontixanthobacter sp.]|uniref:hypothetical protein n=1 Tax=Allopontixanthobacter sp. TaxID=2906452 RepID=UPI002AB978BC|nr:hypothetical protein [Allopontixanthobacter sp.]MDZ4308840.1 hypothetical protein [Allopontixanthobacter sp.]
MPADPFDYSETAIAYRTLARMAQSEEGRASVLDTLWFETRERALLLYPRVAASLDPARTQGAFEALKEATERKPGWISTAQTPDNEIASALVKLLAALGIDLDERRGSQPASGQGQDAALHESEWAAHIIYADMRQSRFAGTGIGGTALGSVGDAIRRLTMCLISNGFLNHEANGGELPNPGADFGRPQLIATQKLVASALEGSGFVSR